MKKTRNNYRLVVVSERTQAVAFSLYRLHGGYIHANYTLLWPKLISSYNFQRTHILRLEIGSLYPSETDGRNCIISFREQSVGRRIVSPSVHVIVALRNVCRSLAFIDVE
jgi:hypothetical protein